MKFKVAKFLIPFFAVLFPSVQKYQKPQQKESDTVETDSAEHEVILHRFSEADRFLQFAKHSSHSSHKSHSSHSSGRHTSHSSGSSSGSGCLGCESDVDLEEDFEDLAD